MADDNSQQGLQNLNSTQQQAVKNLGLIIQTLQQLTASFGAAFIQFGGTSTSATAGGASALPGPPQAYVSVVLPDGTTGKIPVYKP